MTSLRLMFIHESQFTRRPLYVSPDFSSTSMGEFSAALRSDNGNCVLMKGINHWSSLVR